MIRRVGLYILELYKTRDKYVHLHRFACVLFHMECDKYQTLMCCFIYMYFSKIIFEVNHLTSTWYLKMNQNSYKANSITDNTH